MTKRTFIHKVAKSMSGLMAFKDRPAVLRGDNVAGFRWKPFVIWPSENARVFKHISEHIFPAYYRTGKKSGRPSSSSKMPS